MAVDIQCLYSCQGKSHESSGTSTTVFPETVPAELSDLVNLLMLASMLLILKGLFCIPPGHRLHFLQTPHRDDRPRT